MAQTVARKYKCLTPEQQETYEKLSAKQRAYVDYRGRGYDRANSYRMAGYGGKKELQRQAAHIMESRNPQLCEIVDTILRNNKAHELAVADSELNRRIDALATQKTAEKLLEAIDSADGETARRIAFYRDIVLGKIKTVRKTVKKNACGEIIETKIEEMDDVNTRIQARKELDKVLGLNTLPTFDTIELGGITVNIVDASKKEELEDTRNTIDLNMDKIEVIDGEEAVVVAEVENGDKGK